MSTSPGSKNPDWDGNRLRLDREERIAKLEADLAEAKDAVRAMFRACDEWAAEFTQKKRAMNWGVVNDAYMKAGKVLNAKRRSNGKVD